MLPFLDLFQRENIRNELFKSILNTFNKKLVQQQDLFPLENSGNFFFRNLQGTNDPLLISALLHCAKSIHDAIGFVSTSFVVHNHSSIMLLYCSVH